MGTPQLRASPVRQSSLTAESYFFTTAAVVTTFFLLIS